MKVGPRTLEEGKEKGIFIILLVPRGCELHGRQMWPGMTNYGAASSCD